MKQLLPTLKLLLKGLIGVLFFATVTTNLAIAYIMFAPDDMPKPFYLSFSTEPAADGTATDETATSEPVVEVEEQHTPSASTEVHPGEGVMLSLGPKVINLADPSGRRYIRIDLTLEFAPTDPEYYVLKAESEHAESSDGHGEGEGENPLDLYLTNFSNELIELSPAINDTLITLVSSKTYDEVNSAEGKEALRNELMQLINARLPNYRVIAIYFTEFVVQ